LGHQSNEKLGQILIQPIPGLGLFYMLRPF